MFSLTAHRIAVEDLDDLGAFVVALAEGGDGSGEAIFFQVSNSFDEQDRALGLDTYCISTSWGASYYGGLRRCVLGDNRLGLAFDPEAADVLGIDEEGFVQLDVDDDSVSRLREGLKKVFAQSRTSPSELLL